MQTLGERLKHSRHAAKYSQEQLAAAVGISRVMVTKLEGGSCLRSGHIPKIANLLRVDPLWLAEGINTVNNQSIKLETNAHKCHLYIRLAIRDGYLPKPSTLTCQDCGSPAQVYDHRDYNRPLDVEPVCHACNIKRGPAVPFVHVNDR